MKRRRLHLHWRPARLATTPGRRRTPSLSAVAATESFVLRVSVATRVDEPIHNLRDEPRFIAAGREITLTATVGHLVVEAGDFPSPDHALAFLPRLLAGLWNLALEHEIAFRPELNLQTITKGMTQEPGYCVYPRGQKVKAVSAYLTGKAMLGWQTVAPALIQGIDGAVLPANADETDLAVAIELYLGSFYETAPRARFLTRMIALEVLAPQTSKHAVAVKPLVKLRAEIDEQLATGADADARDALESLHRELDFRKELSIRRRIRQLILDQPSLKGPERMRFAEEVVAAYDFRGKLVHTGVKTDELARANETAMQALKLVLRTRLGLPPVDPKAARVQSL
jgi:hypothetical protein